MNVELQPFTVPNFVSMVVPARPRQEGMSEPMKWALNELPEEELAKLCSLFRKTVFLKAGKVDPDAITPEL